MTTRVLIASADRGVSSNLVSQFRELPDVQVVGVETTSGDVTGAVGGVPDLDVVLLHQDLGPLPALDLIRDLGTRHPYVAVILVAEETTAEVFGQAMAAGARGVVASEPTLSELQNRVASAGEWARTMRRHLDSSQAVAVPGRMGAMVAVCGAKGGTGTTTVAVHLAVALAETGRTVCLVDMDLQKGDVPGYLDVQHRRSIADLIAAADDLDGAVLSEALFVHPSGPHLLLAPAEGEEGEDVPARATRQVLAAVRSRYDIVVVDCGSHMVEGNATAVEFADRVVVVATPDLPALRGAKRLSLLWRRLDIRKEDGASLLLVRHDRKNEIQPDLARKMAGMPLLGTTVPAVFRALEEAANTGTPSAVKSGEFRKSIGRLIVELDLLGDEADGAAAGARGRQRRRGREAAGDRGIALAEFALLTPLFALLLLVVWQALLIGLTSMYTSHAANEASRAVAVLGYQTPEARAEVRRRTVQRIGGTWGDADHLKIRVSGGYAEVTIDTPAVLPGVRTSFGVSARSRIVDEGTG